MYKKNDKILNLGKKVMKDYPQFHFIEDNKLQVEFLVSDKSRKSGGKYVYADCEKVKDKMKSIYNCDFIITFYKPNIANLNEMQLEIIMYHELKHIGYDSDKKKCHIVPHDVEDFSDIIEKHGINWTK